MQLSRLSNRRRRLLGGREPSLRFALGLCTLLLLGGVALLALHAQQMGQTAPDANRSQIQDQARRQPDGNAEAGEGPAGHANTDAANMDRKKQLSDDSAKLLTLAEALKAEVDKTNKDMLSMNVIRKANEIEKFAHDVKEKMKLASGGS